MNVRRNSEMIQDLDAEWIYLIATAQTMGIPLEEIRFFLKETSANEPLDKKMLLNKTRPS